MPYLIRLAVAEDKPFLWQMLYYAAHMNEDGETSAAAARTNPDLAPYLIDWGSRGSDLGFVATKSSNGDRVGAAWIRPMPPESPIYQVVNTGTPELAIAVAPAHLGAGIGTMLLRHLMAAARDVWPDVVLSVRAANPAKRLYERFGFVTVERIVNRVGGESFVMRANLR